MYHPLTLNGYSNFINAVKRQRNLGLLWVILQPIHFLGFQFFQNQQFHYRSQISQFLVYFEWNVLFSHLRCHRTRPRYVYNCVDECCRSIVVHNLVHLTGRALQYGGYRKQAFPRNSYVTYTIYVIFRLPQIVCKCICRRDVKAVRDIHSNIR